MTEDEEFEELENRLKVQQALNKLAENERELGIQMKPREWQGLTGGERDRIILSGTTVYDIISAVEAKLKEKNT